MPIFVDGACEIASVENQKSYEMVGVWNNLYGEYVW